MGRGFKHQWMSSLLNKAEIQSNVEKIDVGPSFSPKCLLFLITTVFGVPEAVNSLRVKELENTIFTGDSNGDLVSLENQTSSTDSDLDLSINEKAILRKGALTRLGS